MPHANPAIVNDPFARRLAFVYAAFFGTTGWYLPFFPVWLAARGLDPAAIGVVLAAFQLVRIVATPAGTRLADRHGSLSASIAAAELATVGAMALLAFTSGFPAILAAVILMSFVSAPIMPLIDAYALKGLGLRGRAYGPVRLWGSVAFIAATVAGGLIFDLIAPAQPDLADLRGQLRHRRHGVPARPACTRRAGSAARRQPGTAICASRPSWRSRRPQA